MPTKGGAVALRAGIAFLVLEESLCRTSRHNSNFDQRKIAGMSDQWLFKSETYDNCNCAVNCGCQFNIPSTHGYCQSAFVGDIFEGISTIRRSRG
jgi:hypothetical protein